VRVVSSRNNHRVNLARHFVEHFPEVAITGRTRVFPVAGVEKIRVDIAKRDPVLVANLIDAIPLSLKLGIAAGIGR
jgi:hypothetical protein